MKSISDMNSMTDYIGSQKIPRTLPANLFKGDTFPPQVFAKDGVFTYRTNGFFTNKQWRELVKIARQRLLLKTKQQLAKLPGTQIKVKGNASLATLIDTSKVIKDTIKARKAKLTAKLTVPKEIPFTIEHGAQLTVKYEDPTIILGSTKIGKKIRSQKNYSFKSTINGSVQNIRIISGSKNDYLRITHTSTEGTTRMSNDILNALPKDSSDKRPLKMTVVGIGYTGDGLGSQVYGYGKQFDLTFDSIFGIIDDLRGEDVYRGRGYDPLDLLALYITITRVAVQPSNFTLYHSASLNCVFDSIIAQKPALKARVMAFIKKSNFDLSKPVTSEIIDALCKGKSGIRVKVMSSLSDVWYDPDPLNKKKLQIAEVFAHNNHASPFVSFKQNTKNIVYHKEGTNALVAKLEALHQPVEYMYTSRFEIESGNLNTYYTLLAAKTGDTLYKTFQPPSPDDLNSEFNNCKNELAYLYRKFYLDNNLRPISKEFLPAWKEADSHYLSRQRFQDIREKQTYYSYDRSAAFASDRQSPYYSKYQLPGYTMDAYNIKPEDNLNVDYSNDLLNRTGLIHLLTITFPDNEVSTFLRKLNYFRAGEWYTTMEMYAFLSEGYFTATFDYAVVCHTPINPVFPKALKIEDIDDIYKTNPELVRDMYAKKEKMTRNTLIGRLIAGNGEKSTFSRFFAAGDDNEQNQLLYTLQQVDGIQTCEVNPDIGCVEAVFKATEKTTQQYHIHSYKLAYHFVEMIKMMVSALPYGLVAYNVDGFYTERPMSITNKTAKAGEFKYEGLKQIKGSFPETGAKIIEPVSMINPTQPYYLFKEQQAQFTVDNGPAGCGKSQTRMIRNPAPSSIFCFPTNELVCEFKNKMRERNISVKCTTYHKLFHIGTSEHNTKQEIYDTVVLDECSMLSLEHRTHIENICKKWGMNLRCLGDINPDGSTEQCGVAFGTQPTEWNNYKVVTRISDIRRQSPEDCIFFDNLRGMNPRQMVEKLLQRCTVVDVLPNWVETNYVGIGKSHKVNGEYNRQIWEAIKLNDPLETQCVGRATKTRKVKGEIVEANGQIGLRDVCDVWFGRTSATDRIPSVRSERLTKAVPDSKVVVVNHKLTTKNQVGKLSEVKQYNQTLYSYEAAYFRTADAIQGSTIDGKIVIDLNNYHIPGYLYTAVTRCRKLSEIVLIN